MFDLTGKTALVTGASGGLGGAIARAFHARGATVVLSGTREDALAAVAAADPVALIEPMRAARAAFYQSCQDFPTWGNGWLKRNTRVALAATAWAKKG